MEATFPRLAMAQAGTFFLSGMSIAPAESISGVSTIVPTLKARWNASLSFVLRNDEEATLQWLAFLTQMRGMLGTTLVPCRSRFRPLDRDGHTACFENAGGFSDAQTMEQWGFVNSPRTMISVTTAGALRDTQLEVSLPNSTGIRPGHYFSVGERLHRVSSVWHSRDVGSSPRYGVAFYPPLRANVNVGARLEVDRPVCKMRFASETEGLFEQILARVPSVDLKFVEAL